MNREVGEEYLPYEGTGEEGIESLECIQDESRPGGLGTSEIIFSNRDDRFDFRGELSVRGYFDCLALNFLHVPLDLALVSLEPDVL